MKLLKLVSLRFCVLFLLWILPATVCLTIACLALYQTGWLGTLAILLPATWLLAWAIGKLWPRPKLHENAPLNPLTAANYWTPRDEAAIQIVERFRVNVADVDPSCLSTPDRYFQDARALMQLLAEHYQASPKGGLLHSLSLVEILTVIHLAVEDTEEWVLQNVPGSDRATIGQLGQIPRLVKALDIGQSAMFLASSIFDPSKLLTYPLWRKASRITHELQNEVLRKYYQHYLRQLGHYLIEMYSGRLQGGSRAYRQKIAEASSGSASNDYRRKFEELADVTTKIAVMGQVNSGKSSLINALLNDNVASTSQLPETRVSQCYRLELPNSQSQLQLIDTPGSEQTSASKSQLADIRAVAETADIILLCMAANAPARAADVLLVKQIKEFYLGKPHLKPPPIIGVITHVDLLRPVRQWDPPYDWRQPQSPKEHAIAETVNYCRELFGDRLSAYACVFTGSPQQDSREVFDELVPVLVSHLDRGHAAAVLKAFYKQLSQRRLTQLAKQTLSLLKTAWK